MKIETAKTLSPQNVVDTLKAIQYGYAGWTIKDDRLEGAYVLASELTGLSVDALGEMVENPYLDEDKALEKREVIIETEAVETCPYCGSENTYPNWDVEKQGYITTCTTCGEKIFLCDECMHAEDNPGMKCDWCDLDDGGGQCFRGCIRIVHGKGGKIA